MLSTGYNNFKWYRIEDTTDYFINTPGSNKIKAVYNAIRVAFSTNDKNMTLETTEGGTSYRYVVYERKVALGWFVYMPGQGRMDLYIPEMNQELPIIQWKDKRVVYSGYPKFLGLLGFDKMFMKVLNVS